MKVLRTIFWIAVILVRLGTYYRHRQIIQQQQAEALLEAQQQAIANQQACEKKNDLLPEAILMYDPYLYNSNTSFSQVTQECQQAFPIP